MSRKVAAVDYKLLGPVKAYAAGGRADLLSAHRLRPRHRLLLAALLLAGGQRVGTARLIELMWGIDQSPEDPENALHHYASKLRATLRIAEPGWKDPLPPAADGYRIDMKPQQVDAFRFRNLTAQARARSGIDDGEAVRLWRLALAEWSPHRSGLYGPEPLAGLPGQWADNRRTILGEEHRDAVIGCLDAELRLGQHQRLLTELAALEAEDGDDDEDLKRIGMLAYYRLNRPAEALSAFQRLEQSLKRSGREPSRSLRILESRIRQRDPGLDHIDGAGPSAALAVQANRSAMAWTSRPVRLASTSRAWSSAAGSTGYSGRGIAITARPAAAAERTPLAESSTAAQRSGRWPSWRATAR